MSIINKLKAFTNKKKKSDIPGLDEILDKNFEVDFNNIWKYNVQELTDFINKYEKHCSKIAKKFEEFSEDFSSSKEKMDNFEKDKKRLLDEKEQYKINLDNIQKLFLENEEKNKNLNQSCEELKKQNNLLKTQLEKAAKAVPNEVAKPVPIPDTANNQQVQQLFEDTMKKFSDGASALKSEIQQWNEEGKNITASYDKFCALLGDFGRTFQQDKEKQEELKEGEEQIENKETLFSDSKLREETVMLLKDFEKASEKLKKEEIEGLQSRIQNMCSGIFESVDAVKKSFENYENTHKSYLEVAAKQKSEENSLVESLKKELESALEKMAKKEKIEKDLEKDLLIVTEKLGTAKTEGLSFQNHLKSERDTFLKYKEEKESELQNLKKKVQVLETEHVNMKKELETAVEKGTNSAQLEELRGKNEKLEKSLATIEESSQNKQRELENKLIQERLRLDQKIKDLAKLEEQYKETKTNLNSQIELNNQNMEKLKVLEQKLTAEKKNSKDWKKKSKNTSKQLLELQNKSWNDNSEKEEKIKELEEKLNKREQDSQKKKDPSEDNHLEKDLLLKNQELKISEFADLLQNQESKNIEMRSELENLRNELKSSSKTIEILTQKRELALDEIKKLSQQVQILKSGGDPSAYKEQKYEESEDMRSSFMAQSPKSQEKNRVNFSTAPNMSSSQKNHEFSSLMVLKKDLESLYRDFIQIMPLDASKDKQHPFIKLEKKMNDSIKKTQDFLDNLEDLI